MQQRTVAVIAVITQLKNNSGGNSDIAVKNSSGDSSDHAVKEQ